jgi:hypothetical protein
VQGVNGADEAGRNEFNDAEGVARGASENGGNGLSGVDGAAAGTHGKEVPLPSFLMAPFCLGIIFTSSLPFSKNNGKTFSKFSGFLSRKLRLLCFGI